MIYIIIFLNRNKMNVENMLNLSAVLEEINKLHYLNINLNEFF